MRPTTFCFVFAVSTTRSLGLRLLLSCCLLHRSDENWICSLRVYLINSSWFVYKYSFFVSICHPRDIEKVFCCVWRVKWWPSNISDATLQHEFLFELLIVLTKYFIFFFLSLCRWINLRALNSAPQSMESGATLRVRMKVEVFECFFLLMNEIDWQMSTFCIVLLINLWCCKWRAIAL